MSNEEAYRIIDNTCAAYRGTRYEHQTILEALTVIRGFIPNQKTPEETTNVE